MPAPLLASCHWLGLPACTCPRAATAAAAAGDETMYYSCVSAEGPRMLHASGSLNLLNLLSEASRQTGGDVWPHVHRAVHPSIHHPTHLPAMC